MLEIVISTIAAVSLGIFALHAVEAYQTHKRVTP